MRYSCLFLLLPAMIIAGCRNSQSHSVQTTEDSDHQPEKLSYTVFSDSCEYFTEIAPMVKGAPVRALVHVTRLTSYMPVMKGSLVVTLMENGLVTGTVSSVKPAVAGIYPVTLTPEKAGKVSLVFTFTGEELKDSASVKDLTVFEDQEAARQATPIAEIPGAITFTKEMAWKVDFKVQCIVPSDMRNTIKVSGELLIPPAELTVVTAKSSGLLIYQKPTLVPGARIQRGASLFAISSQGLTTRNSDAAFTGVKSRYEMSKAAYDREKTLVEEQIVSRKQFAETVSRFKTDSAQYFAFLNGFTGNRIQITAPGDGFVTQLFQPNGAYVEEGAPLAELAGSDRMLLQAALPQRYQDELPLIQSASFRIPGNEAVYETETLGGKIIAKGGAVTPGSQFVPVTFEFTNKGQFIAGAFAEIYLHTTLLHNQLVVPIAALMEEQGTYYVYVQAAGESYLKKSVKPGTFEGSRVNILSGLEPGDRVVTKGAVFIKAAAQMKGVPSHDHEH